MKCVTVLSMLWLLLPVAGGQTETARISGKLLDAKSDSPVPAAVVMAIRNGLPPLAKNTRSGGDGAFEIPDLPAGTYSLCVQARGGAYLDPCQWDASPATVSVVSGQPAAGIWLPLTAASVVSIHVRDERKLLEQRTKDGRGPELTLGVWGPKGLYYPARLVAGPSATAGGAAANSYSYEIVVPRDTALTLHVSSKDLKLGDATGAPLPANASQEAFQHAGGDANSKSFAFTALGLLP